MMLDGRFPMLRPCARWAILALGTWALLGCGPESGAPESRAAEAASARSLVRAELARSSLTAAPTRDASGAPVTPGPTQVVLGHRTPAGTLRVGCVDSEDGAEALVRAPDEER